MAATRTALVKGTDLRVFAGTGASFPLTPFVVFKVRLEPTECDLDGTDSDGNHADALDLSQLGSAEAGLIGSTARPGAPCWPSCTRRPPTACAGPSCWISSAASSPSATAARFSSRCRSSTASA